MAEITIIIKDIIDEDGEPSVGLEVKGLHGDPETFEGASMVAFEMIHYSIKELAEDTKINGERIED